MPLKSFLAAAILFLTCSLSPFAQCPPTCDNHQLLTKIIPIGDWDMRIEESKTFDLGFDAQRVVYLSAIIYSDPVNNSAVIFNLEHFNHSWTSPPAGSTVGNGLGGGIRIMNQDGTYKVLVHRGRNQGNWQSLFYMTNTKLPDGTPVTFSLKPYNRGNIRILYTP